ncbi:hypothetical protein LMH87_005479 [Akanthomyces muscarius]|uniref:Mediator of RNA polymerase II transcription subunit 8 n=1 Tax=Akanthomyces muscarius TaxID=2231603 RepID=A0A9W8QKU4_AKAMU|nr:hypothetical protein LMH87_005479 [Akanthomyces muscarius]KAJ4163771.1 hypothetical protein LMH87_005479 [Akanthomyces muscarius]
MAALGLDDDELKSVEQILSRLAQLSNSIGSLKMDVMKSHPLPHPDSLHASAQILHRNLATVLECLSENAELFTRIAIHPSTNFPGRAQEGVLTQLLRKKLEPDVEELVEQGRETARRATPEGLAALQAIWDELRAWTQTRIADYVRDEAGDAYTKEERAQGTETVRTGLRRDIEDEDEDEDEEDEDEDEDGGGMIGTATAAAAPAGSNDAPLPPAQGPEIETLLWFGARGDFELPRNVEYERKGAVLKRGLEGINIPPERMDGVLQAGGSAAQPMQL